MKKQLVIIGIVALLVCVWLSGYEESHFQRFAQKPKLKPC
jgi:hypothetical protein